MAGKIVTHSTDVVMHYSFNVVVKLKFDSRDDVTRIREALDAAEGHQACSGVEINEWALRTFNGDGQLPVVPFKGHLMEVFISVKEAVSS